MWVRIPSPRRVAAFLAAGLLGSLSSGEASEPAAAGAPPTLTRVEQVRTLTTNEAVRGYRVKLTGVITLWDTSRGLVFLQDATGGVFISPQNKSAWWRSGQKVEVTGIAAQGNHLPYIDQALVLGLGEVSLPPAKPVTFAQLATDTEDSNWVEVRGVVRSAINVGNRLLLEIAADGKRLRALFTEAPPPNRVWEGLVDAEVRIQGVCGMVSSTPQDPVFLDLHVPNFGNLAVEVKTPGYPDVAPLRSIASLIADPTPPARIHRVRVSGTLGLGPGGTLRLADSNGVVQVQASELMDAPSNQVAEVLGFPGRDAAGPVLEDAVIRILALSLPQIPVGATNKTAALPRAEYLPVLRQVTQIRGLTVEEARRGYPVRVQGVVTFQNVERMLLFVQDDSAGIYVYDNQSGSLAQRKVGEKVEVMGFTGPGLYAPIIILPRYRLLGQVELPLAKPVTFELLRTGQEDSQRVEIRGVVHAVSNESNLLTANFESFSGGISVRMPWLPSKPLPTNLVDAVVRVAGVCVARFNDKQQWIGVLLYANRLEDFSIEQPAPVDPYAQPLLSINSLLRYQSGGELSHRVRVQGVVTYRDPRWSTLFVQNDTDSLFVRAATLAPVSPGDRVEVAGFVSAGEKGPFLSDALFRRVGSGPAIEPKSITIQEAISGEYDAQLVSLEARLVDWVNGVEGRGLVLQSGSLVFEAFLESSQSAAALKALRVGSLLRLTGISALQSSSEGTRRLWIQLRTPADVEVLKLPSWWTGRRIVGAAGVAGAVLLAAVGWVVMLRLRVQKQTEVIRQELASTSLLNQITRAAAERQDMISIFRVTMGHLETHLPIDFGGVLLYDPDTDSFKVAARGPKSQLLAEEMGMGEGESLKTSDLGMEVCMKGEISYTTDLRRHQAVHPRKMAAGGMLSVLAVPLAVDGQTYGVLTAARRSINGFNPAEIEFLRILSESISLAAHHARLRTDLQNAYDRLRETQKAIMQQERLAAVGQLAAGVAHEFNNILTVIQGHTGLLLSEREQDPETAEALKEVSVAAGRAANLTRQLLAFSRKQIMQPKILDLNEAIGSVVRMLQRLLGENIELQLDYASRLPSVRADVGMMELVLVNLAVNARDAMPQGGRLKLRTFEREVNEIQAKRHPEARAGHFVCLSVTDTGCGMDATVRSHLFEPFFTTKEVGKGTGLGLATIYGIVKQHEGWIEVESAVGQGTTFTLFLPAVFAAAESSRATSSKPGVRGGSETILVVEDEPALRSLVRTVLARYGYVTLEAADGIEAMQVWRQNAGQVRLLLTDLVMPGGISGRELAEKLQAEQPSLKVIYTSGYSLDMAGEELVMRPGFSFLAKPYAPPALAMAVRSSLDGNPAAPVSLADEARRG